MARKKTNTARLLIAAGATVLLAACAPGEVTNEGSSSEGAAPEVQTVDPAEFAGETLSYVYFTDGPDEQATRDLIAGFEDEYDVTVNLEILPYADLVTSVQARLSGGNAPDVVRLTSLTDFRADLLDLRTYLGEDYAEEFLPGPVTGATGDNGELLAVPSDATLNGPFVNVDMFEEAGVELPDPADPWTWEEMVDAATEVQEATGSDYAFAIDKSGHRLSTILSQYGTALVDGNEVALDPQKAEQALAPLVEMMADDRMPRDFWLGSGTRYEGANEIFLAQATPVYLSGNWQVGQFAANAEFNWAVAPNPCADECGGFPGGKYMAALAEGPNPALAAEFIRYMNTAENQETFVAAGGFLPTRADLSEEGVQYPARQADMDMFLQDLERTPELGYEANAAPAFSGAGTALVEALSRVVAGEQDLGTAMSDLQQSTQSLVEELAP
ncbi:MULTISPECIES: extracellular solute-binding protein [unclassified Arthrobacter]|uniref:ABC transporter substrate-binding protein n=1 Tax=unclassified Arthrobacter TaxID=235627 RepID=UPI0024DF3E1D|nr:MULTISPECIES: extracellular solute-binding protein [unclassified Arthrobacter]MCC9146842.1 extracellular solute-binding protein [Arthrobacter sp. zg-Y919]MDK1278073.1 extracellular solute-binding protein [Arthrobacter sp. zg.Y919]WIB03339.1 extracellular solute-binding protein [Arthrobacter sp. zg-Y919]